MATDKPTEKPIASRLTWESQVVIPDAPAILTALRAAGLPLANVNAESAEGSEESDQSKIVCVASVSEAGVHALVAFASGLMYRFEPKEFDVDFWAFAARNYYWVTGCMADRQNVAERVGVPIKEVKGKTLSRAKGDELSRLSLDALLERLGYVTRQGGLF